MNKARTELVKTWVRSRHEQIGVKLGSKDLEKIDSMVQAGAYMNRADFVRSTVREKLVSIEILKLRMVSHSQARKEILKFLKEHGQSYASYVAGALHLDLDMVFSFFEELQKEGLVE